LITETGITASSEIMSKQGRN